MRHLNHQSYHVIVGILVIFLLLVCYGVIQINFEALHNQGLGLIEGIAWLMVGYEYTYWSK